MARVNAGIDNMTPNNTPRSVRPLLTAALWISVIISSVCVIYIGRSILVPLVLAMLGVFLVEALSGFCQGIPVIGAKLPKWASKLLAHIIIITLAMGIFWVVADNAGEIGERSPVYQERLQSLYSSVVAEFGMDELDVFSQFKDSLKIGPIIGSIAGGLTGLMGNGFLVILFFFFMTLERQFLNAKLVRFFDTEDQVKTFNRIWTQIDRDIRTYLGVKTFVSLLIGVGSYVILRLVDIDFPAFWALLIFIFNYIPNIGSVIATALPTMLALVQFEGARPALIVLVGITALQLLIGNVLEPQLTGNSLNLSPLTVILSLTFWAALWGIPGMLLCVPFTVISMIIFAQFPSTRRVAVLLSRNGEIKSSD